MRTRIMLAGAVVLAVAVIGTARPAAGLEPKGEATVVETALSAPLMPDSIRPAAESPEPAVVQEKEKQKESEKAKVGQEKAAGELKLAVEAKSKDAPLVLTITQGTEVKTLTLDKPLTITTSKAGENVVLTVDGKEIQVLKGEPIRLEIKGGELRILDKGVPVKIGEGGVLKIGKSIGSDISWTIQTDKKDHAVVYYGTKDGKVVGELKAGKVIKEGEPDIAWTIQPKKKGEELVVYGTPYGIRVNEFKKGTPYDRPAYIFSSIGNKDMLEKVKALQEQVQAIKAKKLDLSALEESLKKLEEELASKEEKDKGLMIGISKAGGGLAVAKVISNAAAKGETGVWISEARKAKGIVETGSDENTIQMVFTSSSGATAADFERAAAKLKKDLPEGYKIEEQKFEDGVMRFTIKRPEGTKADHDLVHKLVESIRAELKDKK